MHSKSSSGPEKLSAGVVVAHCLSGEFHYLLLRAYRNWDFPKGLVESNESPLAAARREVKEETGLSNLEFRWGDVYFETVPYAGGKIARYYIALSSSLDVTLGVSAELGKPEHHEYRWVDYETGCALLVPRIRAALDWAHTLIGDRC